MEKKEQLETRLMAKAEVIVSVLNTCNDLEAATVLMMACNSLNRPQVLLLTAQAANLAVKVSKQEEPAKREDNTDEDDANGYVEDDGDDASGMTIEEIERESIRRALERNNWNRKRTAEDLHISERTLCRKMKQYDLKK